MSSRRLLFALLAFALVAAPAAQRAAASPCNGPAPMSCCGDMGEDGAPPCHCSLGSAPPVPAAFDAPQAPAVSLAETPLRAVAFEAFAEAANPAPVARRARSAPLFLLFSVLLV